MTHTTQKTPFLQEEAIMDAIHQTTPAIDEVNLEIQQAIEDTRSAQTVNADAEKLAQQGLFATPVMATCYSRIDNENLLTHHQWYVTLLRREKSKNPHHAFIIVEGINEQGLGVVRRYDFVTKKGNNDLAEVIAARYTNIALENMHDSVEKLVKWEGNEDTLYYKTWRITRTTAQQLDQTIKDEQGKDWPYNMLGDLSYSASRTGDNCFTWARRKLNELRVPTIQIAEQPTDFIVAAPDLYLQGERTSAACLIM